MAKVLRASAMNKCIGCFACMHICACVNAHNHSLQKSSIRVRSSGGLSGKQVAVVCHACKGDRACAEACPCDALQPRVGDGVLLDADKCIGCRRCESACNVSAISFDEETKKPIICRHCGMCARFCPHECLTVEEVADDL